MAFLLEQRHIDDIIGHSVVESPNECCGVLAGTEDRVAEVYRAVNVEASPEKYSVEPASLLRILKDIESKGCDVVGFYHSHTHTEAYPSPTDKRLAFWPECRYVIISLMVPKYPEVRAFHIVDGDVTEDPVRVVDSPVNI